MLEHRDHDGLDSRFELTQPAVVASLANEANPPAKRTRIPFVPIVSTDRTEMRDEIDVWEDALEPVGQQVLSAEVSGRRAKDA
jgi:hypothetical protein